MVTIGQPDEWSGVQPCAVVVSRRPAHRFRQNQPFGPGSIIPGSNGEDSTDWDLWVIDADGSNLVQLTQGPRDDTTPSWSPDGHRIAYTSKEDTDTIFGYEIWVIDADGSNLVQLTPDYAEADSVSASRPAWSPDGRRIAYNSNLDGSTDIWVMDANGDNPVNLTANPESEFSPSWSPDGQRIAYVCESGENRQICLMNADGTDQAPLTDGSLNARNPVWTPDGSRILFSATVVSESGPSPRHIFSINIDSFDVINLTEGINPDGQYLTPAVSF